MATPRQLAANRLNALNSTGPRTPEGKAVSSQNALKSGLDAESQFVAGEDRDDFITLQREYFARFRPLAPEERFQVDTLIRNEWILRRLFRAEAHLWEYHTIRADRSEGVPLGEALVAANDVFRRLQRRITLAERSYKDALDQLTILQRARPPLPAAIGDPARVAQSEEPAPQPDQRDTATQRLGDAPELASFFPLSAESPQPPLQPDPPRPRSQSSTLPSRSENHRPV